MPGRASLNDDRRLSRPRTNDAIIFDVEHLQLLIALSGWPPVTLTRTDRFDGFLESSPSFFVGGHFFFHGTRGQKLESDRLNIQ
jgi:hypothetical protein